jgi:hypothetical protein
MTAHATGKQVFIGDTPVADAYSEDDAARIVAALNTGTDGAPVLRFSDAEQIGGELHDRWQVFAGNAPMARDDMGWADAVQFVVRRAREIKTEREREEGNG